MEKGKISIPFTRLVDVVEGICFFSYVRKKNLHLPVLQMKSFADYKGKTRLIC
jgi:hypothetical protein